MEYGVYCIMNTLSGCSDGLFLFLTDGQASVELASRVKHVDTLKEVELYKVGSFNVLTKDLGKLDRPLFIPWDTRRLEKRMEEVKDEKLD